VSTYQLCTFSPTLHCSRFRNCSGCVWLHRLRPPKWLSCPNQYECRPTGSLEHQQYVNLVSGFCWFPQFLRFWKPGTPGKGIYTIISKGSSQGLTYLGLTCETLQAGFLKDRHGFPGCHVSEFFSVFSVFFWFPWLRNPWKPNCLITDEGQGWWW
jgi:hypothetical protein